RLPARVGARLLHPGSAGRTHGHGGFRRRQLPVADLRDLRPARRARPQGHGMSVFPDAVPVRSGLGAAFSRESAAEFEINTDAALLDPTFGDVFDGHDRRFGLAISHFKSTVR